MYDSIMKDILQNIFIILVLGAFLLSGCNSSTSSEEDEEPEPDAPVIAIIASNTGSGDFELSMNVQELKFCYSGEGCVLTGGVTFSRIGEGERVTIHASNHEKNARGVIAEYTVLKGEGYLEAARGNPVVQPNGWIDFDEVAVIHKTGTYNEGNVIRFEAGQTN